MSDLRIRERTEEEIKALRVKIGFVISIFGLLCLYSFIIWLNYPFLDYLWYFMVINPFVFIMYMGSNGIIILFIINIIGLGLIYFSLEPRFKGHFLLIFAYLSFFLSFLIMPSDYYFDITELPIYLILIDIPISFMIIFGIISITKKKAWLPDFVAFIPIIFITIFPFILNYFLGF
ncbi:MAG: hypothetical protein ACFE9M_11025 [Promethearchaeota archaeon]